MDSYEDLRLQQQDKIPKVGFFQRLLRREHKISEKNLDFLETHCREETEQIHQDVQEPLEDDTLFLDDLDLRGVEQESQVLENTSLEPKEKQAVLEMDLQDREIPLRFVCFSLACLFFALLLFVPKIYMRNNIYYSSRNIIQLQTQLDSLNEENKHIKKQLEDIKFKNLTYELDF